MAETKIKASPIYRELPKKKHHKELRIAVSKVLDEMLPGTIFSSLQFYEMVVSALPISLNPFIDTIMRYARMYRRDLYICIDRANCIYQRVIPEAEEN